MTQGRAMLNRAAAMALLAVAGLAIWLLLAQPLLSALTGHSGEEQEKSLQLLARYDAVIAQKAALEAHLKSLGSAADDQTGLVVGQTAAVAAASLQGELRTLIEAAGGEIRSVQVLPVEKIEDFEKIAVQYELNLPPGSLQRLLQALESHRTVLTLDALRVRVSETLRTTDDSSLEARIAGQWVIAGFRRTDANAR